MDFKTKIEAILAQSGEEHLAEWEEKKQQWKILQQGSYRKRFLFSELMQEDYLKHW